MGFLGGTVVWQRILVLAVVGSIFCLLATPAALSAASAESYVVVVKTGVDPNAVVGRLGVSPGHVYTEGLSGFSAELSPAQVESLRANPLVIGIQPNRPIVLSTPAVEHVEASGRAQFVPSGVRYIRAHRSATAEIDGIDERVDADIAVLDSGVDRSHSDLNVAGGFSCVPDRTAFEDQGGHGTYVAGVAAALDNNIGVVGVAPGARIWSVRVLNDENASDLASMLCGLSWIIAHADTIDVANLSIGIFVNVSDTNCGIDLPDTLDPMHTLTCVLVARGVTVTVSAGNESMSALHSLPAAYPEVLTASALSDFDGKYSRSSTKARCSAGSRDRDDNFAFYSNFGPPVDFIAPGTCIYSTAPGNKYGYVSGTSFSAPHAAGAAALVKAKQPDATPAEVRARLTETSRSLAYRNDPDGIREPTLDVAAL